MVGGFLEQAGNFLLKPIEAVHNAIATDEQKAEYEENGTFAPGFLVAGTLVVGFAAIYGLTKAKVIKPKWATVTKYRKRAAATARRYYRRRK